MKSVKIKSIKRIPKNDRYDLTVPKNHNFFANNILIHNTSGRTGFVLPPNPNLTLIDRVKVFFRVLIKGK